MTVINLPTCIDCDRVVRTPGYCYTCKLSIDLARRSAEAAERERMELTRLGVVLTPLGAAGLAGDDLLRARDALAHPLALIDEAELARLLYRPSDP